MRIDEILEPLRGMYAVEMGIHSKIPTCCILFFVTAYGPANDAAGRRPCAYFFMLHKKKSFGYIPCPKCFEINNRIKIHKCTMRCEAWYRKNKFGHLWKGCNAYKIGRTHAGE